MQRLLMRPGFLTSSALFLAATLSADTLILRDGRRVEGQLISVQNGIVEFDDARAFNGRVLRFDRNEILGIEFSSRNERSQGRFGAPPAQAGRPSGLRERQVMVAANVRWTDTGVDVQPNQDVYFEASGEVGWGPGRRDGPAGENNSPINSNRPLPNRPAAALIGRVGENSQDAFYIGADRGALRMRSPGRLFLGVNDDYLQDNAGAFRVIVFY